MPLKPLQFSADKTDVNPTVSSSWLSQARIEAAVRFEPGMLIVGLALGAYLFYRFLLRGASHDRHRLLRGLFRNLLLHTLFGLSLFMLYWILHPFDSQRYVARMLPYVGLMNLIWGALVFVKVCRILAFEYLFLTNMQVGVPLLVINLLSLLLSLILGGWILSTVFEINLAPLLATSAIFSIVLGLALQDTLGNLFAGVALQFDKPYEIGDWIEIQSPTISQRWQGQVREISWRATFLLAFTEEIITIPNRVMAQAEVSNFSARTQPFLRGHYFRISLASSPAKVREALLKSLAGVGGVLASPEPAVLLIETTESWAVYKLIYYIQEFGRQYVIGDQIQGRALELLEHAGIPIAAQRVSLVETPPTPA